MLRWIQIFRLSILQLQIRKQQSLQMIKGTRLENVTGTSDKLPIEAQLKMIRELLPDAKKIGILYTTSEANSVSAIAEYKEKVGDYGFELVEKGISKYIRNRTCNRRSSVTG